MYTTALQSQVLFMPKNVMNTNLRDCETFDAFWVYIKWLSSIWPISHQSDSKMSLRTLYNKFTQPEDIRS